MELLLKLNRMRGNVLPANYHRDSGDSGIFRDWIIRIKIQDLINIYFRWNYY